MLNHRYKKNKNVELIETEYLNNMYVHHGSGEGKITSLIPRESWLEPLVPLYEVKLDNKNYVVPEYSILEIDRRKK